MATASNKCITKESGDSLKTLLQLGSASLLGAPLWVACALMQNPAFWLTLASLTLALACFILAVRYSVQMTYPAPCSLIKGDCEFFDVGTQGKAPSCESASSDFFQAFSMRFTSPMSPGKV